MQVSVETNGALERTMKVEVPEEKIVSEVENRLKSMSKTTKIQGFRPGKVPMKLIQKRYGPGVRQEVVGELVQNSYYDAITQEKLRPAGMPTIDPLEAELGQGLVYTAKFEVMPDIKLSAVEELEIEKPLCEIVEEDTNKMIETLRKQQQNFAVVEREAVSGDKLKIDFVGKMNGEVFEGGEAKDFELELGSNSFIPGFEDGLIGKKAGEEVTLDLTFPDPYQKEEFSGKPVEFTVTIHSVSEAVLAELDDDFFKNFGVQEGGYEAFVEEIKQHMSREAETALRNRQRDAVMNALHDANKVDLPKTMIEAEQSNMQKQFVENLKQYGVDNDKAPPVDIAMFEEQATRRVALQLIVAELIRENELQADPAAVREMLEKNAASYEDPSAVINWYYSDKSRLAEVEAVVLEDAVIDWVSSKAVLKEQNLGFDELMNKGQTESE
ncbi:MAG: trigger factor [Gammaproteobacteria bacterium]|nr:trigger factor [Gammaproteobacteria bacterium]